MTLINKGAIIMNDDLTRIEMEFPTPKLTSKKTIEKEVLGTNVSELAQEYNLPNYMMTQILEHELPDYTYSIVSMLYKNNLLNLYLDEMK